MRHGGRSTISFSGNILVVLVTYSPSLEMSWSHGDQPVTNSEAFVLSKEDGGFYHCDISQATPEDEVCEADADLEFP